MPGPAYTATCTGEDCGQQYADEESGDYLFASLTGMARLMRADGWRADPGAVPGLPATRPGGPRADTVPRGGLMAEWLAARRRTRRGIQGGTHPDHTGPPGVGPRCREPLAAYEVRGIPALPGDVALCGRPEGHGGQCYSEAAWKRKLEANARGVLAARRRARGEADDRAA